MTHRFALLVVVLVLSQSAFALSEKFDVDHSVDLGSLSARSGQVVIRSSRSGDTYLVDASVVVAGDTTKFINAAADFEHYERMRIPLVIESHLVSRQGDELVAWLHVSGGGADSKHYLSARLDRSLGNGQAGMSWTLADVDGPYRNSPSFTVNDGAIYVKQLDGGKIYARYTAEMAFDTLIPQFLIEGFVKRSLQANVQQALAALISASR